MFNLSVYLRVVISLSETGQMLDSIYHYHEKAQSYRVLCPLKVHYCVIVNKITSFGSLFSKFSQNLKLIKMKKIF